MPLGGSGSLQDEAEVISRGDVPGSVFLHDEGEVLGMVIRVVGENVEHHPQVELVQLVLGNGELPAGGKEILVAACLRIDGGKCLGEDLLPGAAVEAFGKEMVDALHGNQA